MRRRLPPGVGAWDVPGGFLGFGEAPEAGAVREVLEEAGVGMGNLRILGGWVDGHVRPKGENYTLNTYYLARPVDGTERAGPDEGRVEWFPLDELPEPLGFEHLHLVLEEARRVRRVGRR